MNDSTSSGPFVPGRRYRVRHSFEAMRATFTAGDVLIFDRSAWSRYDGITGYFFRMPDREGIKSWDIYDDEDVKIWKKHFEELPAEA